MQDGSIWKTPKSNRTQFWGEFNGNILGRLPWNASRHQNTISQIYPFKKKENEDALSIRVFFYKIKFPLYIY